MIAKTGEEFGFANGLRRVSADSADANERDGTSAVRAIHFFGGYLQDGFEEAEAQFANGELRGVNAHSQAAGAGSDVIASERALAAFIETAITVEREGVRGDDGAVSEELLDLGIKSGHDRFC